MRFILVEDIASTKRQYPKIPDQIFDELIRLDPTFKEGKNTVGTYGKWILNLYNKGKLNLDAEKDLINPLLTAFEENKSNFDNKDISQFKTVNDLQAALDNVVPKELSHRQQVRQAQKMRRGVDLKKDAQLVFEDSEWEVYIPLTYAASCKLGQGTSWCTATTETNEYYEEYTEEGPLYILINKHNEDEKYQFHFPSMQFMDKDDDEIYPYEDILSKDSDLNNFFSEMILKDSGVSENLIKELSLEQTLESRFDKKTFAKLAEYFEMYFDGNYTIADFLYNPKEVIYNRLGSKLPEVIYQFIDDKNLNTVANIIGEVGSLDFSVIQDFVEEYLSASAVKDVLEYCLLPFINIKELVDEVAKDLKDILNTYETNSGFVVDTYIGDIMSTLDLSADGYFNGVDYLNEYKIFVHDFPNFSKISDYLIYFTYRIYGRDVGSSIWYRYIKDLENDTKFIKNFNKRFNKFLSMNFL